MQGLYRGKSLLTDKWVYGSLLTKGYHCWIIDESVKTKTCMCDIKITSKPIPVDGETVGQYSTLDDNANMTKIFKRDILDLACEHDQGRKGIVDFVDGCFVVRNTEDETDYEPLYQVLEVYKDATVIGNPWDNPELLSH